MLLVRAGSCRRVRNALFSLCVQRQSREYELVIEELRALLASRDCEAEPVPTLRGTPSTEQPESPHKDSPLSPRGRSRPGQRPAAPAMSAKHASAPSLKRTQSSPPKMSRGAPQKLTTKNAKPPVASRTAPLRSQKAARQEAEPVTGQQSAPVDHSKTALAPASLAQPPIPYQQLISSLQALDQRKALSHSPPRDDYGGASEQGWGAHIETVDRSLHRERQAMQHVPDAKRAAGSSYLDRLLRQLKLEQQQGARGMDSRSRDTELLSSGEKSLPDWHLKRRCGEG